MLRVRAALRCNCALPQPLGVRQTHTGLRSPGPTGAARQLAIVLHETGIFVLLLQMLMQLVSAVEKKNGSSQVERFVTISLHFSMAVSRCLIYVRSGTAGFKSPAEGRGCLNIVT